MSVEFRPKDSSYPGDRVFTDEIDEAEVFVQGLPPGTDLGPFPPYRWTNKSYVIDVFIRVTSSALELEPMDWQPKSDTEEAPVIRIPQSLFARNGLPVVLVHYDGKDYEGKLFPPGLPK